MKHAVRKQQPPSLSTQVARVLWVYVRTQFILSSAVTALAWGGLLYVGVQHAALLGFLTGALSLIPVIGITVAALVASVVATVDSVRFLPEAPALAEGIVVIVMYGFLNALVDYILSPWLVGRSARMHPLVIFASVIAGTVFFGIAGAVFAVPVVLVGKTVIEHVADGRNHTDGVHRRRSSRGLKKTGSRPQ